MIAELVGTHASVAGPAAQICERAAGNPFFAEEIVRDLAERRVLTGEPGHYFCPRGVADVSVPATVQATIAECIDRLDASAKHALNAAAVIGTRFDADLVSSMVDVPETATLAQLIDADLIEPAFNSSRAKYAFRHPLIRAVAYESQLRSRRAALHRRLAAAIEERDPGPAGLNAALIAEHLEAAGDLRGAYSWHMRAGTWGIARDIRAARISWSRASQVADRLPADEPNRSATRIAPRTLLCGTAWRVGVPIAATGFDELRDLCVEVGDELSLVLAIAGQAAALYYDGQYREASRLASEVVAVVDSIGDPAIAIRLLHSVIVAKLQTGHVAEVLRLAQSMIDLAGGDPAKGQLTLGSPLAVAIVTRGFARGALGMPGWKDDFDRALAMTRGFDLTTRTLVAFYVYGVAISLGWLLPDATALRQSAEILALAEENRRRLHPCRRVKHPRYRSRPSR